MLTHKTLEVNDHLSLKQNIKSYELATPYVIGSWEHNGQIKQMLVEEPQNSNNVQLPQLVSKLNTGIMCCFHLS